MQEEYWAFVRDKVSQTRMIQIISSHAKMREHWLRYPIEGEASDLKSESESNLLILLSKYLPSSILICGILRLYFNTGKLREGLLAAKREDEFALNGLFIHLDDVQTF